MEAAFRHDGRRTLLRSKLRRCDPQRIDILVVAVQSLIGTRWRERKKIMKCQCPLPTEFCPVFKAPMRGRKWEICSGNCPPQRPAPLPEVRLAYLELWGWSVPQRDEAGALSRWRNPCVHKGEKLGQRSCGCTAYACALHGECTLTRNRLGIVRCFDCNDYVATGKDLPGKLGAGTLVVASGGRMDDELRRWMDSQEVGR